MTNKKEQKNTKETAVMTERKPRKLKSLATMLAGVILGMGIMIPVAAGFKNGNIESGLKIENPADVENLDNFVLNNGGMVPGETQEHGICLMSAPIAPANYADYGISPIAETAYTLTATITPAEATNKAVDWSVEFANPSGTWAKGKIATDYVTVTPTSDGALTANVTCLKAFGEKINVKVICRDNTKVAATCITEYEKKLTDVKVTLNGVTASINDENISFTGDPSQKYPITVTPVYTAYTLDKAYEIVPRQELVVFPSVLSSSLSDEYYDIRRDFGDYNTSTEFSIFGFCLGEINGYLYTDGSDYNRAVNYYKTHVRDSSMKINVINKTNSNAIVGSLIIDLTNAAFKIAVSGVSVGNSTVIF